MLDRALGDAEQEQIGHFVNEELVLDSDIAGFGSPKMEFEEIGEFLRDVEDSERDRETCNLSQ